MNEMTLPPDTEFEIQALVVLGRIATSRSLRSLQAVYTHGKHNMRFFVNLYVRIFGSRYTSCVF